MGIIEKLRLDGKKAFITGGARGIGKSISLAIAEAGADVAIVDIDITEAEKTARLIGAETGVKTVAIKTDITDPLQVERMIQEILTVFGRLDIAFCNAGIAVNAPAEEMTLEQWTKVVNVNLTVHF